MELIIHFVKILLLYLIASTSVAGQRGNGSDQLFGNMTAIFVNGRFDKDKPWTYMFEAGIRSSTFTTNSVHKDRGYDIGSIPIRIGFGYQIDKENSVMIGYLYQYSQPPFAKTDVNENRAWEQYQNIQNFKEYGILQNRIRFEQRELEEGYGTALRTRYQLKYIYPLSKDWSIVFSDEIFWNLNTVSWGPVAGFDQNRVFIGPGYQINQDSRIEFGYLNNYTNKDLNDDLNMHMVAINLYYNVPN